MILSMAFPNIIGSVILAPRVLKRLEDYWGRYTAGEMKTYAEQKAADKAATEAV
jgi:AGCS family alanine or glycine:cation symporter